MGPRKLCLAPLPSALPPCSPGAWQSTVWTTLELVVQASLSSIFPAVPFTKNQRKRQGSYQSTEWQFWTWGPWQEPREPMGTLKLHCTLLGLHSYRSFLWWEPPMFHYKLKWILDMEKAWKPLHQTVFEPKTYIWRPRLLLRCRLLYNVHTEQFLWPKEWEIWDF